MNTTRNNQTQTIDQGTRTEEEGLAMDGREELKQRFLESTTSTDDAEVGGARPLHEERSTLPRNYLAVTRSSSSSNHQVTSSAGNTTTSSGDDGGSSGGSYRNHEGGQLVQQQPYRSTSNTFRTANAQGEPPPSQPLLQQQQEASELVVALESPHKPATVIAASQAPILHHSESNSTSSSSSSSSGSGGEGRKDSGHYHTIRRVLTRSQSHQKKYRASSTDSLSSSAEEEEQSLNMKMMARKGSKKRNLLHHKRKRLDTELSDLSSNDRGDDGTKKPLSSEKADEKPQRRKRTFSGHELDSPSADSSSNEDESSSNDGGRKGGHSSGSGTDGGYAGSASSNGTVVAAAQDSSYSSPSETSSEESQVLGGRRSHKKKKKTKRARRSSSNMGFSSESSEIADFSSGSGRDTSEDDEMVRDMGGDGARRGAVSHHASVSFSKTYRPSPSPELSSSSFDDDDDDDYSNGMLPAASAAKTRNELEDAYLSAKRAADAEHEQMRLGITKKQKTKQPNPASNKVVVTGMANATTPTADSAVLTTVPSKRRHVSSCEKGGRPPIMTVGCDIMAHVLTFLEPPEILEKLTMPLSKSWQQSFTLQPELWRVLCLVEPFKATVGFKSKKDTKGNDDDDGNTSSSSSSSSDSFCSLQRVVDKNQEKARLDRFRSLYTSFVRCMKYLSQIREDARNGRQPTYIDYGTHKAKVPSSEDQKEESSGKTIVAEPNEDLQRFLAEARDVVLRSNPSASESNSGESGAAGATAAHHKLSNTVVRMTSSAQKKRRSSHSKSTGTKRKPRFAASVITGRLLGPSDIGDPGNMNLPWSCAIYSIINWMVAYADVEGIQTICLNVLPDLLENDQQRMTAQSAGVTDIVLKAMLMFPNSVNLHISAFHTIVLLARPMGGREGMLFRSSMTANGIFGPENPHHGRSGIGIMLDSMKRFKNSTALLAMSCWALVNIALNPRQKKLLVKLGGIQVVADAMRQHPFDAEVQFRALFALINLVIPSPRRNPVVDRIANANQQGEPNQNGGAAAPMVLESDDDEPTERSVLDATVGDVACLVVKSMKNFCSSANILDRACLVLHNLSLNQEYHTILLWTPNLYQMLEWSVANYRTSSLVLTQSASAALQRLQNTLAHNEALRSRFRQTLKTQQTIALERAHDEARRLIEEQEAMMAVRIAEQRRRERAGGDNDSNEIVAGDDNANAGQAEVSPPQ